MGSKREEERNEKIIRGLMKLPPNRRCINCNSLGPQYVCTTFSTFVCVTCSGIHREFSHRVKSVSMSKFNSQEVDALQKGGNQRAREIYLKTWDPEKQRLPDNRNVDKIREFIKKVYVEKTNAVEKSLDWPPKDPKSLQNHELETRQASSYHSYSQSPPYDFQYEERRYGKHPTSVTRKPGSDHILYEGRFSSFSSPSRSSDHGNNERFTNEGSICRSFSGGVDMYRYNIPSRSPQTAIGSPFSETSSYFSTETPAHPAVLMSSLDADNGTTEGRIAQPERGSFESFDAVSFKSVNSMSFDEVVSEPEKPVEISHAEPPPSVPSLPQSSTVANFSGVDFFSELIVPQSVTSTPTSVCEPQLSAPPSYPFFQQPPFSSAPMLSDQKSGASSCSLISDEVHHNGGWATFDMPQNLLPAEDFILAIVPSTGGNNPEKYNPFSLDQYSSSQDFAHHEPSGATYTLNHDGLQNLAVEPIENNAQVGNAFEDSSRQQPAQNMLESTSQDAQLCSSDATKSLAIAVYDEALNNDGNVKASDVIDLSNTYPHFDVAFHDFPVAPAVAGVPVKPSNPFDLPCDADFEANNMFWNMSSLQGALPNTQMPAPYMVAANWSCFPPYPISSSYVNGGITFGPESGPFGFQVGQTPSTNIPSIHTEASVASVGGNPFA